MRYRWSCAATALVLSATGTAVAAVAAPASSPGTAVAHDASPNPGSVNAYWISGPGGVVIVDSGRNVSGGRKVVARVRRLDLPVVAVLLTHPHPDHVGGLGVLHTAFPDAPIYASRATSRFMRTDPLGFYPLAHELDPGFPATVTLPDHLVRDGQVLSLGGFDLLASTRWAPGESRDATTYQDLANDRVFVGDLVDDDMTPALLEGHSCGWLHNLADLAHLVGPSTRALPGHGRPAPARTLIRAQRNYLHTIRRLVARAVAGTSAGGADVTPAEQHRVLVAMARRFPDHPDVASLPTLKQVNVDAVAGELRADPTCR